MPAFQGKNLVTVLKFLVLVTVVAIGFMGVLAGRGLFADGANFLLHILNSKDFYVVDRPRLFVHLITQFPLILSLRAGVDSLNTLVLIHSASLIAPVLICWLIAFLIHFRTKYFWPLVIGFSLSYLTSGFFAIGEYNLTYALAALCLALLLQSNSKIIGQLALVLASFALLRSYEAMVFLGPPLFLIALHNLLQREKDSLFIQKLGLSLAAFLFSAASTISAWSILFPREPANMDSAGKSIYLVSTEHFIFATSMLVIYIALHIRFKAIFKYILVSISIFACFYYLLTPQLWVTPGDHYSFRALSGSIIFGFSFLFLAMVRLKVFDLSNSYFSSIVIFALFMSLSFPFVAQTEQFYSWAKKFEQVALQTEGWIPSDQIQGLSDSKFYWSWSNPSLSAVLRGNYGGGILNKSTYKGWQPFDPLKTEDNPLKYYKKNLNFY
jgi:hypothetical protein